MNRYRSRTVVITGATGGIGKATFTRLYTEGASLVASGRNEKSLNRLTSNLDPNRIAAIPGDLTDPTTPRDIAEIANERFGRIDGLVNCAGIASEGQLLGDDFWKDWAATLAVNLEATVRLTQAILPCLRNTHGAITNISSLSGLRADRGMVAYSTSKGALNTFTQALALDEAENGVRVNSVCPSCKRS
ncbi:SDR family NAD(P)-dependent oxidoreductase [Micrococcus luteus]|uniref:SDR family NAD(P)-dependent oxidoreductase n=1 Tax=Micrococcus luteus TaxID=1270 RepID=UPI003A522D7E